MSYFSIDASTLATLYICALGLAFMLHYRQGKGKKMRVIDAQPVVTDARGSRINCGIMGNIAQGKAEKLLVLCT